MASEPKNYQFPMAEVTEEALGEHHGLTKMARMVGHNQTVMDFGCATGYFAQILRRRGCTVTGLEINRDMAQAAARFCDKVYVADLDFADIKTLLPQNHFDVAVFGDVLEHLRNPWQMLKDVKSILKPEGVVVACIPNVAHGAVRLALLQGRFDYSPIGILDDTHLRFFTRRSVGELFAKAGYEIEQWDRVQVPVFTDMPMVPKVNRNDFPPGLCQAIEQAEDATTVQFILRARQVAG